LIEPLELLIEQTGIPRWEMPDELERLYGGPLGFDRPSMVANFVQTLDGVVAIPGLPSSNTLIAAGSAADRFLMGFLRACADLVLIGTGTLLASPTGTWRPDHAYPSAAAHYRELRQTRDLPEQPEVAIVTGGHSLDPTHPRLGRGALVLTTRPAAAAIAPSLPAATELVAVNDGEAVDLAAALTLLHQRGHHLILTEGGPTLLASLLAADLLDEIFLTLSPVLAGRDGNPRLALIEGLELLPERDQALTLQSARRNRGHLFLRYARNVARTQ
jgi:riboflavin biosynthesis pyrimidine reductase